MPPTYCGLLRHDPGPCPVDDAPHTTCTSPGYAGAPITNAIPVGPVVAPCRRPHSLPMPTPAPDPPPDVAFTTATYRRVEHGPRRRKARR